MVKVASETPLRDEFDLVMEAMPAAPPPDVVKLLWQFYLTGAMTTLKLRDDAVPDGFDAFFTLRLAMIREANDALDGEATPR